MIKRNAFDLIAKYGSPLYVYDQRILRQRCKDISAFANALSFGLPDDVKVQMHYSTKANNNPAILKIVKQEGLSVECMSPFEFFINKKLGFPNNKILYVCNNITSDEMRIVANNDVLICLDSISQVKTFGESFPNSKIMVRINPGSHGVGHSEKVITAGKQTKFGISEANISELIITAKSYGLKIIGIHQHLGSLFLNDKIDEYIEGVKAGLEIAEKYFPEIEVIDLGGGFGVPYNTKKEKPLDLYFLVGKLLPILNKFLEKNKNVKELKFEPGRYIPCEAGILLGTVTATKKENGIFWVGTDIGMNQLVRPSMYGSYHDIRIISRTFGNCFEDVKVNICGNVCESGDILAKDRIISLPKYVGTDVGDIISVYNAGAYGYSMASNYTGRPRPAEIMLLGNGCEQIIRKREDIMDLCHNFVWENI